jgi:uncharacterized membrane protein
MDVWTIIGLPVFALAVVLVIADALKQDSAVKIGAGALVIVAGITHGADIGQPWLRVGLLALAIGLFVVAERRESETSAHRATPC